MRVDRPTLGMPPAAVVPRIDRGESGYALGSDDKWTARRRELTI